MKKLLLLFLFVAFGASAATFTEFYVQSGGNNLNAGSTTDNTANYTAVGDSDGTSVFTPSDGSTPATTLTNGAWASVYVTSGATIATYVGLVTNVAAGANGAVTFSQVAKAGTFPSASGGAHTITLKQGGAWLGPNAAVAFPFGFVGISITNSPGLVPRINIKGGTTYQINAALAHALNGPIYFQGYTNAIGDSGRATIDTTNAGAGVLVLNASGNNLTFQNLIFSNSGGTSGTSHGVTASGIENSFIGCTVHDVQEHGFNLAGSVALAVECEAYNCNKANVAGKAGFDWGTLGYGIRCLSYSNSTAAGIGFQTEAASILLHCIAYGNGAQGFRVAANSAQVFVGCDAWNNGGDGLFLLVGADGTSTYIENCNFLKNGGYGISSANFSKNGSIINCGFGSGTQANTSGTVTNNTYGLPVLNSITYASGATPWVDPANGNFNINLAAAINAGRGTFMQTFTNTAGYPDLGAAQATNAVSSSASTSGFSFSQ